MKNEEILKIVDHTLLKPTAKEIEIFDLCAEAINNKTCSVCIPPCFVKEVRKNFPNLRICTVIGFPLGYATKETKVFETKNAIKNGADEIDMVVNINNIKDKKFDEIIKEIGAIKNACGDNILKVIVETCYLTEEEKEAMCQCVASGGADYIKTSTGFGSAGAKIEDIKLFKKFLKGTDVKIKAAGGIHSKKEMESLIKAGADRLGCSGAVKALKG